MSQAGIVEAGAPQPLVVPSPTHIVGVGASAGGLEALERMFQNVPADTGMAFVIVQHLSPDFRSLMDELLARWTSMKIHRVTDGMHVSPNSIYLIPPKKEMVILKGRLLLEDKDRESGLSLPIDHFLKSLAEDRGQNAIAVILSGTGSDGSRGVEEIKRVGGLVLVQSDQSAKFDGMPQAARETGTVDLVLDPEEIGSVLVRYSKGIDPKQLATEFATVTTEEDGLSAIFRQLLERFGIDFSHYKLNTIVRRTERRLQLTRTDNVKEYAERLANDTNELDSLYRDLLVGVTRFFRDKLAYEQLERHVDEILASKEPESELRVWVAGCGTGEEAYSIAILLNERVRACGKPIVIRMFATDVHQRSLVVAGAGIYSDDSIGELNPDLLARYFKKLEGGYVVKEEVRHQVVFAQHNIIKDSPFTRMDLISCRNLLIYLQPPAQKKALSLFHFGLLTGSILFLGPSESPGELDSEFEILDPHWKIYRKRRDVRLPIEHRTPVNLSGRVIRASGLPEFTESRPRSVDPNMLTIYDALLSEFVPPALLISDQHELLHVFGDAGRFLQHRPGRAGKDVLELLHPSLRLAVVGAIQQVRNKRKEAVTFRGVQIQTDSGSERITLTVRPVHSSKGTTSDLLIVLDSKGPGVTAPVSESEEQAEDFSGSSVGQMEALESELRYTRENLQATIEELETSNEELQATNEELVASNEELQSTNEELHSVNEELYTVNAEHQRKIQQLSVMTDDMDNLLSSTRVHTVFLDRELKIRKFTPLAGKIFGLVPHDVGRPFEGFAHRLRRDSLADDLKRVSRTDESIDVDVQDIGGNWFLLRILPYQTKHAVDGVLLTLIDINSLKQTQQDLARREFELRTITDHVPSLISYVDRELTYRYVNRRYSVVFGKPAEAVAGLTMHDLHGAKTMELLQPRIARVLLGEAIEFEQYFKLPTGKAFWALVSYIPDQSDRSQPVKGFFICKTIITELKEVEQRFDRAVRGTTDGIWDWDVDTGKVYYAPRFAELLGFNPSQNEFAKTDIDGRIHPEDRQRVLAAELAMLHERNPMDVEFRLQCRDGEYRWFRGRASVSYDASGHATHASGSIHDIQDYCSLLQDKQRQVEQRDHFLAILSHELRNPLGAVTNGCRILQRKNPPPSLAPVIEAISRQSQQMASLLEDLLDVARITEGKIELQRRPLDLREIVAPAVETVQHLFDSRQQVIECASPSTPLYVFGDPVRLQQVVANLLSNASKYSRQGTTVRIECTKADSHVQLHVIDEGEGIPSDQLQRIFEPFEQLGKRVDASGGGIGLGLAVAQSLVRLHDGQIEAHSLGQGHGSRFTIRLPLEKLSVVPSESPDTSRGTNERCRIVLVEDNLDARNLLQSLLEDDGYDVQSEATGAAGLQRIREVQPDVAIIDIGLPEMDGHALARAVRAESAGPTPFLIALTGYGRPEDRQAALEAGFDVHLTKPVDLQKLESLLEQRPKPS